jgi:glutamyl-tRNA synthetase
MDQKSWDKAIGNDETAGALLQGAFDLYADCEWTRDELHRFTAELGESFGKKLGKAQAPIRVAVTGNSVGPPLFESLEVLGRDETRRRIRVALDRLGAAT